MTYLVFALHAAHNQIEDAEKPLLDSLHVKPRSAHTVGGVPVDMIAKQLRGKEVQDIE